MEVWTLVNPPVAKAAMGKPLFKASEGDGIDILRVSEDVTESGLQQVPGIQVLIRLKVRPEAFATGSPMPAFRFFLHVRVKAVY
jgi:hypothetical protein